MQADLPAIVFGESKAPLPGDLWQFTSRRARAYFARGLLPVVTLHAVGALYHQFITERLATRAHVVRPAPIGLIMDTSGPVLAPLDPLESMSIFRPV